MGAFTTIEFSVDTRGVATLRLNRPAVHNAMNGVMYDEARSVVSRCESDSSIRVLVLTAAGASFCSGGDLKYQQEQASRPQSERIKEASKLACWLRELDTLSKPVIGRINGPAYAGGLGLVSVCDIAIGCDDAQFAVTEARLGLLPGMISPYLVRRIGEPFARRLFLTGRRITAAEAVTMGLLSVSVPADRLDAAVQEEVDMVLKCAPGSLAANKRLIEYVSTHGSADNFVYTVDRVAEMWAWDEAEEGIKSFLEKRKPAWVS
ncbi:enoyl-CoA hydratase-related protein [Bradyrhizobium sp. 1]|uniref:enoyl-CoA hydratase-related protein n=1 Tax=Bradyrhizobium sp. 1 TaxID=241591 RepID=UPI001FF8845D|nr:enoyl-CoA hydratase-related protein [Bradyrhizobium sp. 1]MCK1394449.1 enoyl-CoA hydratase/isomerase family protein [Bradyrhizobium sp. 1]